MVMLTRRCAAMLLAGLAATPAQAKVTAQEAARLGKDLTMVGALRAGNQDGSIPEWSGPKLFTQEQRSYTPQQLEELRKTDPKAIEDTLKKQAGAAADPAFTITRANLAQYAGRLAEGYKALFAKYPDYKMIVYPTLRTAFFPDAVYQATARNALNATLDGTDGIRGTQQLGFPFPIPQSGAEVLWNHKLEFRGSGARRYNDQAIVKADGSYHLTKLIEDIKLRYGNLVEPAAPTNDVFTYYMARVIDPPRLAGQITLVHETFGPNATRAAWIYNPGLGRVNRAPDVSYDNPNVGTDGEQFTDQVDMYNGALDHYTWKLLGKREMFIPYNSYLLNSPLVKYPDIIRPGHINQALPRFELHRVWVVEADLKPGMRHQFSKRVFYLDEDSWAIANVDCYDSRGQLWKFQEAHLITAPFVPTVTGLPQVIYDLQSGRYFITAMTNEDQIADFRRHFEDSYFTPESIKRAGGGTR